MSKINRKVGAKRRVAVITGTRAGYGIWRGARSYERRPYWAGLGLLVLLIVSRFLEYESHLMIKAVGFMAAGAVLIYAGIKFEARLRARSGEGHNV